MPGVVDGGSWKRWQLARQSRLRSVSIQAVSSSDLEHAARTSAMTSSMASMDSAVGGDAGAPRRDRMATPSMPGDASAGLAHDQRAGGDVPRLQVLLPEAVEPARGHVAEVERRRSQPAHGACPAEERPEHRDEIGGLLVDVVGKARSRAARRSTSPAAETCSALPLRNAPAPRSAVNSSARVGS